MFERKASRFQSKQRTSKRLLTKEITVKRGINKAWKSVAVRGYTGVAVTADLLWLSIASCLLITLQPCKGVQRSCKGVASGLVQATCETLTLRCLGLWVLSHCCIHWQALRSSMSRSWAGKIYRVMRISLYGDTIPPWKGERGLEQKRAECGGEEGKVFWGLVLC